MLTARLPRRLPYWHNEREMQSSTMDDVRAAVTDDEIPLDYGPWLSVSATGLDFITRLLTVSDHSCFAVLVFMSTKTFDTNC